MYYQNFVRSPFLFKKMDALDSLEIPEKRQKAYSTKSRPINVEDFEKDTEKVKEILQTKKAKNEKILFSELENIFGVSKEAAKVKLRQMGLLKGGSDGSVNDHLRKMRFRNDTSPPF